MFKKIYIEIINYCNLNCAFCIKTNKEKRIMTLQEFKIVLNKIKDYTKYIYLHIQGEPLLHPEFENIILEAYKMGFYINLTTNATLIYKHINILKYCRQINISLQAIYNLNNKDKYLDDICNLINKNYDTFISLRIWGNFKSSPIIEYFENKYNVKVNLVKSNRLINNVFFSLEDEFKWPSLNDNIYSHTGSCLGTISHIGILSDGTCIPCCLDKDGIINLGNIFNDDLDKIINHSRYVKINNGFKNKKINESLCKRCTYRNRFN